MMNRGASVTGTLWCTAALCLVGCGGSAPDVVSYLDRLERLADFERLQAEEQEVKYLLQVDGQTPPAPLSDTPCLFQNTERFPFHLFFLRSFAELAALDVTAYTTLVLSAERVWWGGVLKRFESATHPATRTAGVMAFTIYGEEGSDLLTVADIASVNAKLSACAPFTQQQLAFWPIGPAQEAQARQALGELAAQGVAVVFAEDLFPADTVEVYSEGEGYGYLRVAQPGTTLADYGPNDVVVASFLPNDLRLVAGAVTALPQSALSHVNLRLREKNIPNAAVANIYAWPILAERRDRLVHLAAGDGEVTLEAATLQEAQAFWDRERPRLGAAPADLTETGLKSFAELRHADAISYGVKAANLGELGQVLPANNHPAGFGVPFSSYQSFITANGIDTLIDATLADPQLAQDAAYRRQRLDALRDAFRDGALPAGQLEALRDRVVEVLGPEALQSRIRFRSSTNAEDLEGFSGAGLYRSRSGCFGDDFDDDDLGPSHCLSAAEEGYLQAELARRQQELSMHPERTWLPDIIADIEGDLADEKPVARALKSVWGSLWNDAAFEERDYYGIDQRSVYMGMAVHPAFVREQAEAVTVTHLHPDAGEPLYRIVSQLGEVGVVRPIDPTAIAEVLEFRRLGDSPGTFNLVIESSLTADAGSIWSGSQQQELADLLFATHDHFAAEVYDHLDNLSLDIEVELSSDGHLVLKQARPYLGEQP